MLTVTSLSADAAISYWFVSGNFNGWTNSATSANKINSGTGGSVTIPVTASGINFKMVAEEGGAKWCGVSGSGDEVTIPNNTKTELVWNGGQNIHLNLPANTTSVTFTLTVENGKNYVTATPNTSGGEGGGDTSKMTYRPTSTICRMKSWRTPSGSSRSRQVPTTSAARSTSGIRSTCSTAKSSRRRRMPSPTGHSRCTSVTLPIPTTRTRNRPIIRAVPTATATAKRPIPIMSPAFRISRTTRTSHGTAVFRMSMTCTRAIRVW